MGKAQNKPEKPVVHFESQDEFRKWLAENFDDEVGIASRHIIGVKQLGFEIDYPHQDTTWPNTRAVVEKMAATVTPAELECILRTNALDMLGIS